jgi:hypothetical protein
MTAIAPVAAKTISVTDLNLYYGSFLAVKDVTSRCSPTR